MYAFRWQELLLYALPIVMAVAIRRLIRPRLRLLRVRLNEAILLIPTWLVTIELFGHLLYGVSVFPIWLFVSSVLLGVHLYDYVRTIEEFYYLPYMRDALSQLSKWSFFLVIGMVIARIYSYFG